MSAHSGERRCDRSIAKAPSISRRRCKCGCRGRATHSGLGNGAALTMGCELYIRRWVRDGWNMPSHKDT